MHRWSRNMLLLTLVALCTALIVISNCESAQRWKQKRTVADMRSIAESWEAYAAANHGYGVGARDGLAHRVTGGRAGLTWSALRAVSYGDLQHALVPRYTKLLPRTDAWGRPFEFGIGDIDARGAHTYVIRSFQRDGTPDRSGVYVKGELIQLFDDDLVFSNGRLIRHPEGWGD